MTGIEDHSEFVASGITSLAALTGAVAGGAALREERRREFMETGAFYPLGAPGETDGLLCLAFGSGQIARVCSRLLPLQTTAAGTHQLAAPVSGQGEPWGSMAAPRLSW
jgi:hypothetical protein